MLNARKRGLVSAVGVAALLLSALSLALASQAAAITPERAGASANQALRVAERAKLIGQRALRRADRGLEVATRARSAVRTLRNRVADLEARFDAAGVASATEAATVTTPSETDYVDLGGPSVTIDVPSSGLAEVWATVTFESPNDGLVGLFVDGQQVPLDQTGFCGSLDIEDALLSMSVDTGDAITLSTPPGSVFGAGCGTPGSTPAPVMVETTPGVHTFSLRYADCGCDPGDTAFSDRTLRVAGRE